MTYRLGAFLAFVLAAAAMIVGQPSEPPFPEGHPQIPSPHDPVPAKPPPPAELADVESIDAIIAAFYESMSAEAGDERQWDRLRSLFLQDGRLIAARPGEEGAASAWLLTIDGFIAFNRKYMQEGGYIETEAARRVEQFGHIAHVWSTYEARNSKDDAEPYSRGIYSIQLLKDRSRWWIVNAFWDHERPDNPIPEKYLEQTEE